MSGLDLTQSAARLTAALVDIESVSGNEKALADAVEEALRELSASGPYRDGDSVLARTNLGRAERVMLAGHLDTVPIAGQRRNVPSRLEGDGDRLLRGCGTSDMKAGVAVQLVLAATLPEPNRDLTYVFYECEEVEAERNGLGRLIARRARSWLAADFAVLMEPTDGIVEGGCQGTMRARRDTTGRARPLARAPGWATTRSTRPAPRSWPARRVPAAPRSRSRAWSSARVSTRSASAAAWPATSSRTSASVTGELPVRPGPPVRMTRNVMSARSSRVWT